MIVSSRELMLEARKNRTCLPAFNVYNLETIQAAFGAAMEIKMPVIIAFGESYIRQAGLGVISAIVRELDRKHPYPVVLHLDHCKDIETIREALEAGFTSVMYDGSALPFKENIANTSKVVELSRLFGASVEGELGCLNPEDGSDMEERLVFTDPENAGEYVRMTGVDALAVSVGNAHGLYKGIPNLDFERLEEIYVKTGIPLVLHGCSGLPEAQVRKAIGIAVAKINVNTEIALAGSQAVREKLDSVKNARLEILMISAQERMKQTMRNYLSMCQGN